MKRRIILVTLSFVMILMAASCGKVAQAPTITTVTGDETHTAAPSTASLSTSKIEDHGETWNLSDGVLTISGSGKTEDYDWLEDAKAPWFDKREEIKEIVISEGITEIGASSFMGLNNAEKVTIPDSVTAVGEYAFCYCNNLKELTIPDSVATIGYGAFSALKSIKKLTIPENVKYIDGSAFGSCAELEEVIFKNNVEDIGENVFSVCSSLKSVFLPDGMKKIPFGLFYECESLSEIKIPDSVTEIGDVAFAGCVLTEIFIPHNVDTIGENVFFGCEKLKTIKVDDNNASFSSEDGILFNKDKSVLVYYPESKKEVSYTIPGSVTEIGNNAFQNNRHLYEVILSDNLTKIGDNAFMGCELLTDISIPENVSFIGEDAFADCNNLTGINVDNKNLSYSSDDGILFNKDKTALILFPANKNADSYTVPDTVTKIISGAFTHGSIPKNLTIPETVTEIEAYAIPYEYDSKTVIHCASGSAAEQYAIENNIKYDNDV